MLHWGNSDTLWQHNKRKHSQYQYLQQKILAMCQPADSRGLGGRWSGIARPISTLCFTAVPAQDKGEGKTSNTEYLFTLTLCYLKCLAQFDLIRIDQPPTCLALCPAVVFFSSGNVMLIIKQLHVPKLQPVILENKPQFRHNINVTFILLCQNTFLSLK